MDLTALICCPGPSLAEVTIDPSGYDFTIAVNRAIELDIGQPFDWWAFGDDEALDWFKPAHDPAALFMAHQVGKQHPQHRVEEIEWVKRHRVVMWAEALCGTPRWFRYTGVAVLSLCVYLGATKIDVYGRDWEGAEDFTGEPATWNNDKRWAHEKTHWAHVAQEIGLTQVNESNRPARFTLPPPVKRDPTIVERILGSKHAQIKNPLDAAVARAVANTIEQGNEGWLT